MTNHVKILDSVTYGELAKIENVINPLISEQINDVYNFEFETVYDEVSKFARGGNIIEIEDDYFRIATTSKYLNGNYRVFAEHVSFALSKAYFEDYVDEGVDGTAADILTPMLNQVGWGIGTIASTDIKYYKPSTGASVRKQIIDVADLFGLEIIWNKFSVSLVNLRGSIDPTPFTLGENLIGVSETIDLTGEEPKVSYEVDVLDLSQLEGYEGFIKINLGDVVKVTAPNVDLDIISRIVYRQYNPFSKANVNVHVGSVVRDFTTYMRDKEEDEKEDDPLSNYWLETFLIDDVDMLIEPDINTSYGALIEVAAVPKNIVITLKEKYRDYFVGVFTEQNGKGEMTFSNADFVDGSLTFTNGFSEAFKTGFVRIVISDKPLNTPRAEVQTFVTEIKLTTDTDTETFLLESLNVDNTEYVNSFGIDEPSGADEIIYDPIKRLRIKVKDDPKITDVKVTVNYGETSFNYSKSQFVNGLLSVTPTMPEKVEKATIEVTVTKDTETFRYILNLTLNKDDEENTTGPKYYIESETVTATTAGAQFDFTVPYDGVVSVTVGIGHVEQKEPIQAYWTLIQDVDDMFTGVKVIIKGLTANSVDVSIQAVVQEGMEEVVTD